MSVLKLNSVITNFKQALVVTSWYRTPKKICEKYVVNSDNVGDVQKRRYTTPPPGVPGSGAGGSVREGGGSLGKYGTAQEESYFYDRQKEALRKMKKKLKDKPDPEDKEEK